MADNSGNKQKALGKGLKGILEKPIESKKAPAPKEQPEQSANKATTKAALETYLMEIERLIRKAKGEGVDTTEEEIMFLQARTVTVMGNLEKAETYLDKIESTLIPKLEVQDTPIAPAPTAPAPTDPAPTDPAPDEDEDDTKMMFCLFCGQKIPKNSTFCNFCGQKVVE